MLGGKKLQHDLIDRFGLVGAENVARMRNHDPLCPVDAIRDEGSVCRRNEAVGLAVNDESGRLDLSETVV